MTSGTRCDSGWIERVHGRMARADPRGVRQGDVVAEDGPELDDPEEEHEQEREHERELDDSLTVLASRASPHLVWMSSSSLGSSVVAARSGCYEMRFG